MPKETVKRALKGQAANKSGANGPKHAQDTRIIHAMPDEIILPLKDIPAGVLPKLEDAFGDLSRRTVDGNPQRNPISGLQAFPGEGDPSDAAGPGGAAAGSSGSDGSASGGSGSSSGSSGASGNDSSPSAGPPGGQQTEGNISGATAGAVGSTDSNTGTGPAAGIGSPGQDTGPQAGEESQLGSFVDAVLNPPTSITGFLGKALRGEEIDDEDVAMGFVGLLGSLAGFPIGPAMAIGAGMAAVGGETDPTGGTGGGRGTGGVGPAGGGGTGEGAGDSRTLPTIEQVVLPADESARTPGAQLADATASVSLVDESENEVEAPPLAGLGFEFLEFPEVPEFVPLPSANARQEEFRRTRGQG